MTEIEILSSHQSGRTLVIKEFLLRGFCSRNIEKGKKFRTLSQPMRISDQI